MVTAVADDAALSWWEALLDADANFLIGLAVLTAVAIVALMVAALYTVRRAQEATPPVVVTVIVLGVVTLACLVTMTVRPELGEAGLIAVIGTALGGLAAAITLAFERRRRGDGDPSEPATDEEEPPDAET